MRVDLVTKDRVKNSHVIVANQTVSANLIVVNMTDFDVILSMEWLAKYCASIDYRKKEVYSHHWRDLTLSLKGQVSGLLQR